MKHIIFAFMAFVLFTLSPAYAGSCGTGDYALSLEDMASKYFNQMDANSDEIVTRAEFEASPLAHLIRSFDALEPNESGEITKSAFIETMVKMHPEQKNEA